MDKKMYRWFSLSAVIIGLCFMFESTESCNEAVCASIVSKCMLTQSCRCDLKNCSCCKECFNCLSHLYSECCSCVDMCPKPNNTGSLLSKKSHVEDIFNPMPSLFNALTKEPDAELRWIIYTFPVDHDLSLYSAKPEKEIKYHLQSVEQDVHSGKPNIMTINCTVAYITDCKSWNKCQAHCKSMGASSYRWFHDGCCECIGNTCIKYGINESRCLKCSKSKDVGEEYSVLDDDLDYGDFENEEN